MKKVAWLRVLPACLFLLWGSAAWAQSQRTQAPSVMEAAPATAEERQQAQQAAAVQMKERHKAQMGQEVQSSEARRALTMGEKAEAVAAQMKANQGNPNFDMDAALKSLKRYAIYPLDHYDPTFPIVARTGDKEADRLAVEQLKAQLKNQQ